jgi:hypothetical protein
MSNEVSHSLTRYTQLPSYYLSLAVALSGGYKVWFGKWNILHHDLIIVLYVLQILKEYVCKKQQCNPLAD